MRTLPKLSSETIRTLGRYVGVSALMYGAIGVSYDLLDLRGASFAAVGVFYVVVYLVDFLINRAVVFQSASRGALARFTATTLGSIGLVSVMTTLLSEVNLPDVMVPIVASVIVFPVRFLTYRYWVYSDRS